MKTVYINTKIRTTDDETNKQFKIYLNDEEGKNEIKGYINSLKTVLAREDRDFEKLTVIEVHSEKTVSEYFSINSFEQGEIKGNSNMWIYKVCQGTKERYTVVGRYSDKKEAQKAKDDFYWYNKKPTFIKRISGQEEDLF